MPRLRLTVLLGTVLLLGLPTAARAADPVMPLAEVAPGMRCTALSVVRGTAIVPFDVEVLDVVVGTGSTPRVLVRVSGAPVDDTGIAQGFSGSPVLCPGADGVSRTIGAISEATGDYGNKLVLVTPIESMLGESADPPPRAATGARAARALHGARPLVAPLAFGGVTGPVAAAVRAAGARAGRAIYAAPAAPAATFPPQRLVPGASVAVGLASGDLVAGAVGTVTYVDGDRVWAFGHPLDAAGRRALLLQDAYVFAVIGTPISTADTAAYKFAAPGHTLGTLTNDAPEAVVGRLGALPTTVPLRLTSTDDDTGRVLRRVVQLADETSIGLPTGTSALTEVGPVAIAQTAYDLLRGSPARQSGSMCLRIAVREREHPLRFCNTYVGGSPGAPGSPMASDAESAFGLLDAFKLGTLHVTGVDANLHLRRDQRQAFLVRARATSLARRGGTVRVRVSAERVGGGTVTRTVRVAVPRRLPLGARQLVLDGPAAEGGADSSLDDVLTIAFDDTGDASATPDGGPRSVEALARQVAALHREDGVTGAFAPASADPGDVPAGAVVLRDARLRLTGTVAAPVTVVG